MALAGSLVLPVNLIAADKRIKLGILGTGWWGTDKLLPNMLATGLFELVALCDVDSVALEHAADVAEKAGAHRPRLYPSYKEMYTLPGLDAVVIATPTHWHALQFIDACRQGLHVFLEKPVSYDIPESQAMLNAKIRAGNIVQVDFPRVMRGTNHPVKKFILSGEAGKIYQVQAQIYYPDVDMVEKEIPSTLDFETYCGPVERPRFLCKPEQDTLNWRGIHNMSRGTMVDWGIHYIHNVRQVLDLGMPQKVSAAGGITRLFTHDNPDHLEALFDFGGLPVNWSHRTWGIPYTEPGHEIGVFYYGDKATIFASDHEWEIYPAGEEGKVIKGELDDYSMNTSRRGIDSQRFRDLFIEFAQAIHAGSNDPVTNTLEEAIKTTSCVNFADIAYLLGETLELENGNLAANQSDRAVTSLKREYRQPYLHPYTGE